MPPRRKKDDDKLTAQERLEAAKKKIEDLQASMADLEAKAALEAQELAKKGPRAVALVIALKEVIRSFKAELPDDIPDWMSAIIPQSFPKETVIGKRFTLSESEIHNAAEKARKAISGL